MARLFSLAVEIARREQAAQARIVAIGVQQARLVAARVVNRTVSAYVRKMPLTAAGDFVPALTPLLTDTMAGAHIEGVRGHDGIRPDQLSLAVPWGPIFQLLTKLTNNPVDDRLVAAVRAYYGDEAAKKVTSTTIEREQPDERLAKVLGKMANETTIRDLRRRYGNYANAIVQHSTDKVESKLRETVNQLIQDGTPVRKAIPVLRDAFQLLGLSPKGDYQLETIFRTQSQVAYQAGRWKSDQDPDVQKLLWGYRYSTVGDSRVRPEHRALEGVTLPKNDDFWQIFWPPNGWNCRCTVIPLYMSQTIVRPPRTVPGTWLPIEPEKGFGFHAGYAFAA